jgi:hypothetical protein
VTIANDMPIIAATSSGRWDSAPRRLLDQPVGPIYLRAAFQGHVYLVSAMELGGPRRRPKRTWLNYWLWLEANSGRDFGDRQQLPLPPMPNR